MRRTARPFTSTSLEAFAIQPGCRMRRAESSLEQEIEMQCLELSHQLSAEGTEAKANERGDHWFPKGGTQAGVSSADQLKVCRTRNANHRGPDQHLPEEHQNPTRTSQKTAGDANRDQRGPAKRLPERESMLSCLGTKFDSRKNRQRQR